MFEEDVDRFRLGNEWESVELVDVERGERMRDTLRRKRPRVTLALRSLIRTICHLPVYLLSLSRRSLLIRDAFIE